MSVRTPCDLDPTITVAPSALSRSAVVDPKPPAPPASTISRPSRGNFGRLQSDVAERENCEKNREHLAVAEVVFEEAFGEDREYHSDRSMQHEPCLGGRIPAAQTPMEIE